MVPKRIWLALAFALGAASPASGGQELTVLAGDTSGIYFPLGIAIGKILSDALPERTVQVQVSKGSVANLKLLAEGKGEIAFAQADSMEAARRGDARAGFEKPLGNLRSLGALYPDVLQIVASAKSGIRKLSDLKGKRLAIGASLSGTALSARTILSAAGLDHNEIGAIKELSFSDSITQMKEDKIDATLQSAGIGVASLNELSNTTGIVMLGIPNDIAKTLPPPFIPAIIPANTYRGQADAVPSVAVMNYLVIRDDLPNGHVANLVSLIFDHLDLLRDAHPAARAISLQSAMQDGPLPQHPAVQAYFRVKLKRAEADALNTRGEALLAKGDRVAALSSFAAALKLDPQHQAARDNQKTLARVIEREGAMMGVGGKK